MAVAAAAPTNLADPVSTAPWPGYIVKYGVANCPAEVLRVVAAMCEAMAELRKEAN